MDVLYTLYIYTCIFQENALNKTLNSLIPCTNDTNVTGGAAEKAGVRQGDMIFKVQLKFKI